VGIPTLLRTFSFGCAKVKTNGRHFSLLGKQV
jgi:hypothetical protein